MATRERVRSSQRVKMKPQKRTMEYVSREEQIALRLALANSKTTTRRITADVPFAPTFYPTLEEFQTPLKYITKLHAEGRVSESGICKIVPPSEWKPPTPKFRSTVNFPTKLQDKTTPIVNWLATVIHKRSVARQGRKTDEEGSD